MIRRMQTLCLCIPWAHFNLEIEHVAMERVTEVMDIQMNN